MGVKGYSYNFVLTHDTNTNLSRIYFKTDKIIILFKIIYIKPKFHMSVEGMIFSEEMC